MARPGSVAVVTTSTDPTGTGRWLRLGQHTLLAVLVLVAENIGHVKSVALDCDGDALLIQVDQVGAACHTGTPTCFEAGGELPTTVGSR